MSLSRNVLTLDDECLENLPVLFSFLFCFILFSSVRLAGRMGIYRSDADAQFPLRRPVPLPPEDAMDGLILAAGKDRDGESDSTLAFQIGANQFHAINHVSSAPVLFDNTGEQQGQYETVKKRVIKAIADGGSSAPWDAVAIFCHGGANALWSAGLIGDKGAQALADAIRPRAAANVTIILYACSAGQAGGFASMLADKLSGLNAKVYGHTTAKHTYANPDTVLHPGGEPVIAKNSPLWTNWSKDIVDQSNDLWARFPFMSDKQLEAELSAPEYLLGRWKVGSKSNHWYNVFFDDLSIYETTAESKYTISDTGQWSADAHKVTVTWSGGNKDVWPLHLSLHGQHVRSADNEGKITVHLASRVEAPNVNDPGSFSRPSSYGDDLRVEYA
jgi:hypothetical protein